MSGEPTLRAGDKVLVGRSVVAVDAAFASVLESGDVVVGVGDPPVLRRIPAAVLRTVDEALRLATAAFDQMRACDQAAVTRFFALAAARIRDDSVFAAVAAANEADVASAKQRSRSTTRLVLSAAMREGMAEALEMWRDFSPDSGGSGQVSSAVLHEGWTVEEHRAPLGVIGFVFEGRPNVFADATGVLRGGNTVVFRIGSDALGTARALMSEVVLPSLDEAGLPRGAVQLVDSAEHAAGWAMFSDNRLALAVARGSGQAVADLGSIARQTGTPVSLHGTGGAWMIVGADHDEERLSLTVEHSLDRKVCNTLNTVCVVRQGASRAVPIVVEAATRAARRRGMTARIHATPEAIGLCGAVHEVDVRRQEGVSRENNVTETSVDHLGHEFEWEENPEFHVHVVEDVDEAVDLFNRLAPRFIVSCISRAQADHDAVWAGCDAPFVGDGFTRWVDGQFALLRPELGLSNWQAGRLFARSGILGGDSAYTLRLRVHQTDVNLHR